jgi:hypothetical protein
MKRILMLLALAGLFIPVPLSAGSLRAQGTVRIVMVVPETISVESDRRATRVSWNLAPGSRLLRVAEPHGSGLQLASYKPAHAEVVAVGGQGSIVELPERDDIFVETVSMTARRTQKDALYVVP